MKRIVVLGATGSIGVQCLDVVRRHPERLNVVGLAANSSAKALQAFAEEFDVADVALMDEAAAARAGVPGGMDAVIDVATLDEADTVVVAVAGVIGLLPTVAAIRAGKEIALASKEVLVAAGELVMPMVRERDLVVTPIDSEHSAIWQAMRGYRLDQIERVILTASGGPFRGKTIDEMRGMTVDQALAHPTWNMGGKITVDSASMMNKGLERIEARWLFDLPIDQVEVVVHPQSVVHSLVILKDGSALAQMGWPDMRLPIQVALLHPHRVPSDLPAWNPVATPTLTFEDADPKNFPSLRLAREAVKVGGTMPCVLNAANEAAVGAFLARRCGFVQISEIVEKTMVRHSPGAVDLDNLLDADRWARETVAELLGSS